MKTYSPVGLPASGQSPVLRADDGRGNAPRRKPNAAVETAICNEPAHTETSVIDSDAVERDREWTRIEAISCLLAVIVLTALIIVLVPITAQ